jgi:hypothetical protein
MAISNILGLFTSPEQYQAQQLAQQQANEQQRAINFAGLDPRGQATYGTFLGAQQLGRGFAGLLGVQDPQLQRIRQRDQLMQSINPADPASLMAGIRAATNAGDQELALTLTDFMNRQGSEMALAAQRQAQADRERVQSQSGGIQEAARINEITVELSKLDPNNTADKPKYDALVAERNRLERTAKSKAGDKFSQLQELYAQRKIALDAGNEQDVQILDRLINSLAPEKGGDKGFEPLARAERIGVLTDELAALETNNQKNTPQYRRKAAELKSLQGDKAGAPIKELVLGEEIVKLDAFIRDAKNPAAPDVIDAKTKVKLYRDAMKRERPNLDTLGLAKGGKYDGQPVFLDENTRKTFVFDTDKTGNQIEVPYTGGLKGLKGGTDIKVDAGSYQTQENEFSKGLGRLQAKRYDDASSLRDNSITALNSLDALVKLNDQGLISGAFATNRVGLTNFLDSLGFTSQKDKEKLASSENYQKVAGDVVLAALGGKLGAGFSNEDRKFINGLIPQLETSSLARRKLLDYLVGKNKEIVDETTRLMDFAETRRTLNGYVPKIKLPSNAPSALSSMSKEELEAAIAKKKKEGK